MYSLELGLYSLCEWPRNPDCEVIAYKADRYPSGVTGDYGPIQYYLESVAERNYNNYLCYCTTHSCT